MWQPKYGKEWKAAIYKESIGNWTANYINPWTGTLFSDVGFNVQEFSRPWSEFMILGSCKDFPVKSKNQNNKRLPYLFSPLEANLPVWGACLEAGAAWNNGDPFYATGWALTGLAEALTFGLSSELAGLKNGASYVNSTPKVLDALAAKTSTSLVETASGILKPGGNIIGKAGSNASIRELSGGIEAAQSYWNRLVTSGAKPVLGSSYKGTLMQLPNGGTIGFRTIMSRSSGTAATIDVNIPGLFQG